MAINPVNLVRVSNNLQTAALVESLRRNTLNLFLEQNRLATGNKLNTLSDDPATGSQALRLTEVLEHQNQVLANIRHANSMLSATDTAVGEIHDLLIQAHSLASEAVNTTFDQDQRDATAELIKGIIAQLVNVGNRKLGDVYLFSGQRSTTTPFTQITGGVEYHGDAGSLLTRVDNGPGQAAAVNLSGLELFGTLAAQISGYADLDPVLSADTRLADLGGTVGAGVQRGVIRVTLSSPPVGFPVDLSAADTLGDVVDQINAAAAAAGLTVGAGNQFNAALNAAGNGLVLAVAAGTITVAESGQGVTGRDLGILGTAAGTLAGADLQPKVVADTAIAALFGGAGATLGSILITNGPDSRTIDLSGATTVQDVLNTINTAGVGVRARINAAGTGIDIINTVSGMPLSVGEAGGNTADLLGIRSLHGGTPLASLNGGRGVSTRPGKNDLHVVAADGSAFDVALTGAVTAQDVIDRINAAAAAAGVAVTASFVSTGNGFQIQDHTGGAGTLQVTRADLSAAIDDLGLSAGSVSGNTLVGANPNGIKTPSVFTALLDLQEALIRGDTGAITEAGQRLNAFMVQANRVHGVVGARAQAMETRMQYTEAAVDATKALLSQVKDIDFTEAITAFQKAQTALQANLMSGSKMLQLSLLDFIG
ncbi:MAG: hypothetical protein AMXMBFR83_10400 [Phycisphaerae bacterium]